MNLIYLVVFSLLLLSNALVKLGEVVVFYAEQDRIAAEQCVQREVENNCCKGKCVLTKRIEAIGQPVSSQEPVKLQVSEWTELTFLSEQRNDLLAPETDQQAYTDFEVSHRHGRLLIGGIFHPPALVS